MKVVGKLYCTNGDTGFVKSQTDYVVSTKEVSKDQVRNACKAYIEDYFGAEKFEKDRGISIDKLIDTAILGQVYERYIPISEYSADYDLWGAGSYTLVDYGGHGSRKVWVLHFTDDPFKELEKDK